MLVAALERATGRSDVHFAMKLVRAGAKLGGAAVAAMNELVNAFPQNGGRADDDAPFNSMDMGDRIEKVARVLLLKHEVDGQGRKPLQLLCRQRMLM